MRVPDVGLAAEVASPCIGVCRIGQGGLCEGCLRTRHEIAAWPALDRAGRLDLLEVLRHREAQPARRRA